MDYKRTILSEFRLDNKYIIDLKSKSLINFMISLKKMTDLCFRYPIGTLFSRQHAQHTDNIDTLKIIKSNS